MTRISRPMAMAMLSSAAITALFVSSRATRDALFLTSLDITALPMMLIATSICSLILVAAHARGALRIAPQTLVPAMFAVSGVLFLLEWLLRTAAPSATAIVVYLHVSSAGPLLASGFWLIASERFDPRTARKRFGQIAGAGTLGGLVGALVSERVATALGVPSMLLFLALFQFVAGWLVRVLATSGQPNRSVELEEAAGFTSIGSGLRAIADAPHLRHLMTLVLLGTTSAALLDYLFKASAVDTFGRGDALLHFFARYYAITSLLSFVLQTFGSRYILERFGLALTTSTPSIALLAGSVAGLIAPGFGSLLVARGGEAVFRASWFRAGYELFYTPLPPAEKRAAKSLIDVALDRVGDALGGGLVRLAIVFVPLAASPAILIAAMAAAAGAILAASHLNRWYLRTLENSLVSRGGGLDLSEAHDGMTSRVFVSLERHRNIPPASATSSATTAIRESDATRRVTVRSIAVDPVVQDLLALRSGNREQAVQVLSRAEGIPGGLVPYVIPLLAWDSLADHALFALRKVAEEHVGALTDALLDPNQDYAVRRRLARVFSVGVSQRAADALMLALDDVRFDVRFQAARSLAAIVEKNSRVQIDRARIEAVVLREAMVGRPIWESRRLLDGFASASPFDEFVRDRAGQSLAHVFTLLSLVMSREPLQIAFRSLQSDDVQLRGTALEYLDEVLPPSIRERLWPFLDRARTARPGRRQGQRDEIFADLLRANPSATLLDIAEKLRKPVAGF